MARGKKTWREKLADAKAKPDPPKVFFRKQSGQTIVVPSPGEIAQRLRAVHEAEGQGQEAHHRRPRAGTSPAGVRAGSAR